MKKSLLKLKPFDLPSAMHFFYLLLALTFSFFYFKAIVVPFDFSAPNSIEAVASFETAKPYQFRLLVPLLFKLFSVFSFIPAKHLFLVYNVLVIYLLLLVYSRLTGNYFDKRFSFLLSPMILYPLVWNYIILNQSFQYYDMTAILLFTAGMLMILEKKFLGLIIIFTVGMLNKETIVYLIVCYCLFNYKTLLRKNTLLHVFQLLMIFAVVKFLLSFIFSDNQGDVFEITYKVNLEIVTNFFSNRIYQKNIFFCFGGLYLFVLIFLLKKGWNSVPSKEMVFIHLAFIPYLLLGTFTVYFTEVRVYGELVPMITTLFAIYIASIKQYNFKFGELQDEK